MIEEISSLKKNWEGIESKFWGFEDVVQNIKGLIVPLLKGAKNIFKMRASGSSITQRGDSHFDQTYCFP